MNWTLKLILKKKKKKKKKSLESLFKILNLSFDRYTPVRIYNLVSETGKKKKKTDSSSSEKKFLEWNFSCECEHSSFELVWVNYEWDQMQKNLTTKSYEWVRHCFIFVY